MSARVGTVVLASAGTGKTFQLTNRLIGLLARDGSEASGILATTFTRKAAGEIGQRVLARLCAGATTEKGLAELRAHVDDSLTRERCAELVERVACSLHEMNVQTIDSFFGRLASGFALELGAPPGWRIIDEDEDDALREEAIGEALERSDRPELLTFLEMLHEGQASRRVRERLSEVVQDVYPAYLQTLEHPEAWEVIGPSVEGLSGPELDVAVRALEGLAPPTNKSGSPNAYWTKALPALHASALIGDWDEFIGIGPVRNMLEGKDSYGRVAFNDGVRGVFQPLIRHASHALMSDLYRKNRATRDLLHLFHRAYDALKRSTRGYRFEDVPRMLLEADATGKLEELYFRLDARLRQVLLDEFQDTSVTQFRLLEPILDELLSQDEGGRGVFCVGDVKQSLYGWREAEPELLASLPERWTTLGVEELHVSWRSSQVVLDAVNTVFGSLSESSVLEGEPKPGSWLRGFREHEAAERATPIAGEVTLLCGPEKGEDETITDQREAQLAFAAERVRGIVERSPGATVGVLFRTGKHAARMIYELRVRGIEASAEGGSSLDDAPAVASALSLLHLADHPGDTQSAFHVAHGPFGEAVGLTSPRDVRQVGRAASELRRRLSGEGFGGVLADLHGRCASGMDERDFRRFDQLVDLADQFDARGGTRAGEFLAMVESRRVEEPEARPVRVMTIHASKGLEFDAVVLPELDRSWKLRPGNVMIDRPGVGDPVRAVTVYAKKALWVLDERLGAVAEQERRRRIDEELCVLYVAMTRARCALEMIVPHRKSGSSSLSAGNLVKGALAPDAPLDAESVLWTSGERDWSKAVKTPGRAETPVERKQLTLARARPSVARLASRSPSAMEGGGRVRLAEGLRLTPKQSLERGSLIHAWFELVEWSDDVAPGDAELLDRAQQLGFDAGAARALLPAFREALAGEVGRALSRERYASGVELDLRREWRFSHVDRSGERPALVTGVFDRLVIGREHGKAVWAEVIDFKTDELTAGDSAGLEARIEHYRPQIRSYAGAAGGMFRIPERRVRAALCFTTIGVVEAVDPGGGRERTESL